MSAFQDSAARTRILAQGSEGPALVAPLVVLGHAVHQGHGEGDEIVGEREACALAGEREGQATAVVVVEAPRDPLPLCDHGLLDRHHAVEISDEVPAREAGEVGVVGPAAPLGLVKLVFVNLDQRTDFNKGPLAAVPNDVAGLGDDGEAEYGTFRVLDTILCRRGCIVRQGSIG